MSSQIPEGKRGLDDESGVVIVVRNIQIWYSKVY